MRDMRVGSYVSLLDRLWPCREIFDECGNIGQCQTRQLILLRLLNVLLYRAGFRVLCVGSERQYLSLLVCFNKITSFFPHL